MKRPTPTLKPHFFLSTTLLFLLNACTEPDSTLDSAIPLSLDKGEFSYTVTGAIDTFQIGSAEFYRAGTHVVVIFESRTALQRLELAYEETRSNHTGDFPVVQDRDPGGFVLLYKNFEQNYWQESGVLGITYSSPDTIIGRMDEVRLQWLPDPERYPDSAKQIQITGHFEAY